MTLVEHEDRWEVEGQGENKPAAYAREKTGQLVVTFREESRPITDKSSGHLRS